MRLPVLLFFSWTLFSSPILNAKKKTSYTEVDNAVMSLEDNLPFEEIVRTVNQSFISDEDKVRAYYIWTANHIEYDLELMRKMDEVQKDNLNISFSSSQHADSVFLNRKAVCEGFSNLMKKFCEASYISCELIPGYTKYESGEVETDLYHAWNAVKIDGTWKLMDVTWATGALNEDGSYEKQFNDSYFLKEPEDFIKDHLPFDPMWQLLEQPVTKNLFVNGNGKRISYFNYNDSLAVYYNENIKLRPLMEMQHSLQFDPENPVFKRGVDVIHNNIAAGHLKKAAGNFVSYLDFFNEVFLKQQSASNFQLAIGLLKTCKSELNKTLDYLSGKTALTEEFQKNFSEISSSAKSNLATVNKNLEILSRLEKNYPIARNK